MFIPFFFFGLSYQSIISAPSPCSWQGLQTELLCLPITFAMLCTHLAGKSLLRGKKFIFCRSRLPTKPWETSLVTELPSYCLLRHSPVAETVQSMVQGSFHNPRTSRNVLSSEHMAGMILKRVLSHKAVAKEPLGFFPGYIDTSRMVNSIAAPECTGWVTAQQDPFIDKTSDFQPI